MLVIWSLEHVQSKPLPAYMVLLVFWVTRLSYELLLLFLHGSPETSLSSASQQCKECSSCFSAFILNSSTWSYEHNVDISQEISLKDHDWFHLALKSRQIFKFFLRWVQPSCLFCLPFFSFLVQKLGNLPLFIKHSKQISIKCMLSTYLTCREYILGGVSVDLHVCINMNTFKYIAGQIMI